MDTERTVNCPHCQAVVDVMQFDPLQAVACPSCGKSFELLRRFAGYSIEQEIGRGGTSTVYMAHSDALGKPVALKVLMGAEILRSPESAVNFLREGELTQKMRHPNIVEVYEYGVFQGFHFMAMEMLVGKAINEILDHMQKLAQERKGGAPTKGDSRDKAMFKEPLPELVCIEMALQAAAGLGVAHQLGLVHGDIKPENIMITNEGVVKVVDFGLVQFANAEKLIGEGESYSVFGTPLYIPPERVLGEPEDFRTDLYSLGATLYHLLRGLPPYRAKDMTELAIMHTQAPLLSFHAVAPNVSMTTCKVIEKSLKKDIKNRYASHEELIKDLNFARDLITQPHIREVKPGALVLADFLISLGLAPPRPPPEEKKKKSFFGWFNKGDSKPPDPKTKS